MFPGKWPTAPRRVQVGGEAADRNRYPAGETLSLIPRESRSIPTSSCVAALRRMLRRAPDAVGLSSMSGNSCRVTVTVRRGPLNASRLGLVLQPTSWGQLSTNRMRETVVYLYFSETGIPHH